MKKLLVSVAALAMAAAPIAASAQSFGHGHDGGGWSRGGRDGGDGGAFVAAGLFGLILGSALTSTPAYDDGQAYAYDQSYAYDQPYGSDAGYAPQCGWRTQTYRDVYGRVEYRQVQICR